jgi:nickel superoxide dismutase
LLGRFKHNDFIEIFIVYINQTTLIMKNFCLSILLIATSCFSSNLFAHCQVPCGVYGDQNRFEQMLEDQTTIEKAGKLISELSGKNDALSHNQLARWVATKESHATAIQNTIADYFMAQRIKASDKKYSDKLAKAHAVMVAAMKCKQTVDAQTAAALKESILSFHKAYEGKK